VEGLAHHAVIAGYGRVAHELEHALGARGIRYLVIEYNPEIADDLRRKEVPVIYGDAANPAVLEHAHLDRARLLAILMPDATAAELATRHARAMNPRLDIVARGGGVGDLDRLRRAGATEVVQPEFEAGQEVIRHALRRFGLGGLELANLIAGRRAAYYRRMAEEDGA
jgi:CPA2 family monovalent cation:H+ antiporter-2